MYKIAVVTNRHLCREDYLVRLERLAAGGADRIILREKDMTACDYERLAESVLRICESYHAECLLHSYTEVGAHLAHPHIHLPLPALRIVGRDSVWQTVGVSVHSVEEAAEAEQRGADYVTAGHIFETDCKRGLAGRGTDFLRAVCGSVRIPVWAIGGITEETVGRLGGIAIEGVCIMSSAMTADDPAELIAGLRRNMV